MNSNERNTMFIHNVASMRREILQRLLDTTRDINAECQYPDTISIADYQEIYDRQGLGTRIIRLMPEECWNTVPQILENEEGEDTEFETTWKDLNRKFSLFAYLTRLDILSGIGRYGCLLIGVNDGKQLSQPVAGINETTGEVDKSKSVKHELLYLRPFAESIIDIESKEPDVSSPRYGQPKMYKINTENTDGTINAERAQVHWTRMIHVADNKQSSDVFGTPRLQAVYNRLVDARKVMGGSAEMFWKGGFPGYAFEINPERTTALTEDEKTAMREEFDTYSNGLQRYLALTGVTSKSLSPQVADPTAHFLNIVKYICITLGVPHRIFMGTEAAKLAAAQDSMLWNRRVSKRQNEHCTTGIIRPFIGRLQAMGIMPESEKWEANWPNLDELDERNAAAVAQIRTNAMGTYITSGASQLIPPQQWLTLVMKFTNEEAAGILADAEAWTDDRVDEDDVDQSQRTAPQDARVPPRL